MSQKHPTLFSENHFRRFQGVQWSFWAQKMKNKMLDVPKTPNLVFRKSLFSFSGGAMVQKYLCGCPKNTDSCFQKITFAVFRGCNSPKIFMRMSQKHRFLFSENHFPRFQGVQRSKMHLLGPKTTQK